VCSIVFSTGATFREGLAGASSFLTIPRLREDRIAGLIVYGAISSNDELGQDLALSLCRQC